VKTQWDIAESGGAALDSGVASGTGPASGAPSVTSPMVEVELSVGRPILRQAVVAGLITLGLVISQIGQGHALVILGAVLAGCAAAFGIDEKRF
jgi:hypothetical protein